MSGRLPPVCHVCHKSPYKTRCISFDRHVEQCEFLARRVEMEKRKCIEKVMGEKDKRIEFLEQLISPLAGRRPLPRAGRRSSRRDYMEVEKPRKISQRTPASPQSSSAIDIHTQKQIQENMSQMINHAKGDFDIQCLRGIDDFDRIMVEIQNTYDGMVSKLLASPNLKMRAVANWFMSTMSKAIRERMESSEYAGMLPIIEMAKEFEKERLEEEKECIVLCNVHTCQDRIQDYLAIQTLGYSPLALLFQKSPLAFLEQKPDSTSGSMVTISDI